MKFNPGLYIVSTPIGNLGDITLRALDALKNSDIIFCEDTRVSGKLLAKHDIKASLKVYNDNSDEQLRDYIKGLIQSGKVLVLISDAGTPLISDPGYKLVRDLKADNIHVDVIPGPCAVIAALTLSGLPTDKFLFSGFLPKTKEGKRKAFQEVASMGVTVVFYDTANRLLQSLEVALEVLGDREANVSRELTKLYQESITSKISELIEKYKENKPRGEIVFTISGKIGDAINDELVLKELAELLSAGDSARSASDLIFSKYKSHYSRKEIYKMANGLKI